MLAVMVGAAQNIISKGAKYSLFDPCKEMAYIPLGRLMRELMRVDWVESTDGCLIG
jgi:ATP/ADP translocase